MEPKAKQIRKGRKARRHGREGTVPVNGGGSGIEANRQQLLPGVLEGTVPVNGGGSGIEANRQQLLPGMLDEVTLREIVVKLPWKSLNSLAAVSTGWLQALRSREVYDARVIHRTLESLVLFKICKISPFHIYSTVGLYSTRDGLHFELPPLPVKCERGIPADSRRVTCDGKFYALGGRHLAFRHVYALDLAGPRQWKKCASMLRKKYFQCAALDGKVYAVGELARTRVLEVYDPNEDTWSVIDSMPCRPAQQAIRVVGEEVFLLSSEKDRGRGCTADVYHPVKHEWRVLRISPINRYSTMVDIFAAHGNLYWMNVDCILVLDMDKGKWMFRHHYSFAGLLPYSLVRVRDVTLVGDELMATVTTLTGPGLHREVWVLESEGFGGKNIDVVWHKSKLCPSDHDWDFSNLCPIEL